MRCMTALAIIEHFDVCKHSRLCLFVCVNNPPERSMRFLGYERSALPRRCPNRCPCDSYAAASHAASGVVESSQPHTDCHGPYGMMNPAAGWR